MRAYQEQQRFTNKNERRLDHHNEVYWASIQAQRWLQYRIELSAAGVIFASALAGVFSSQSIAANMIGLSIATALTITQSMSNLVRQSVELENKYEIALVCQNVHTLQFYSLIFF